MYKEQKFVINDIKSFELRDIFDCGQCFRWNEQEDGSYTGIIKNGVLNVKKEESNVIFSGLLNEDIEKVCNEYFDLNTDYELIKEKLSTVDDNLKKSIEYGEGIRILNQDLWECIISFIISANNNIPRIKKIIDRISENYGEGIIWNDKKYYTFPTEKELSKASVEDLRKLGLGFRDKRVYTTTKMILNKEVDLNEIIKLDNSNEIREKLLSLDGVGEKVADCIMLFSLKRFDVFPVDVWVRRVMNELYIKNENEEKVNKTEVRKIAEEKFGSLAGIAQQYLFYYRKNVS